MHVIAKRDTYRRPRPLRPWLVVLVGLLAGCGHDAITIGARSCESVLDCPVGWTCDHDTGKCVLLSDIQDAAVDATRDGSTDAAVDASKDGEVGDAQADGTVPDGEVEDGGEADAGPATCLYVPTPGQFLPRMEGRWENPVEYSQYDDVVMEPVVANVTDDNGDGVIDTDDVPDIIFASYRYQQDGCCRTPSVLRVVSGRPTSDSTLLDEEFHIATPFLDNSGGLAIGDIDGDGKPEIVGMVCQSKGHTTGTVAFSSVLYDRFFPDGDSADDDAWQVVPQGDAYAAVSEDPPDGNQTVIKASSQAKQAFTWSYGLTTTAIATVRVTAVVASSTGDAAIGLYLKSGGQTAESDPIVVSDQDPYHAVTAEFPKNPFNSDFQWQDGDMAGLEFGVERTDDATSQLMVTQVFITVGYVITKWQSPYPTGDDAYTAAQPAIADLDRDGIGEVIIGRLVLDGRNGHLKWRGRDGRGINSFMGPISIAADLDLDGIMEVIAGNTAYRADGTPEWTYQYGNEGTGCGGWYPCDGYNATGNFDDDPQGEVVTVREGNVYVWEHDGTLKAMVALPWDNCSRNEGGPPTVADFDGDGEPEIGVAGADFYSVIDLECCASLPICDATPQGNNACTGGPGIRWKVPNQDCSSRVTGSSVFDFDGDGAAEVIYNDERDFRIFSGLDGAILFDQPNHSHTRLEYPDIVDVDNDGNAEIVFIENGWGQTAENPTTPIQVWGDSNDSWVPTRRIWNEHAYHITNITEGGLLPPGGEQPNWARYNNYRQNMPDYNVFAAPDLTVTITGYQRNTCPEHLTVQALVCNEGDLRVGPGVSVVFYDQSTQQEIVCAQPVMTSQTLNPGRCEPVECLWPDPPIEPNQAAVHACVDNGTWGCTEDGANHECHEDNNASDYSAQGCTNIPG